MPTGWRVANYTDWLSKPDDAGAFRGEVRCSDASRARRAQWQIATRPLMIY